MDIERFLAEVSKQPKRNNFGGKLKQKPYQEAIKNVMNSPYRELIEEKILNTVYELLPFSIKPETLSSRVFRSSLPYIETIPNTALAHKMQEEYVNDLSNRVNETKDILYNNFLKIFNEKKEIIEKERYNNINNIPFNGYDKDYLQQFKILDRQIELEKTSHENITWFNLTLKDHTLNYDAKDFEYSARLIKEMLDRKYQIEIKRSQIQYVN